MKNAIYILIMFSAIYSCQNKNVSVTNNASMNEVSDQEVSYKSIGDSTFPKTDSGWRAKLNAHEYHVMRQHGTERAFSNEFWDNKNQGLYYCKGCNLPLFESKTKFKSGTGWPSFYNFISKNVESEIDKSYGMVRNEVHCTRCKSHLGHVFEDGPNPTGLRYCINSASLNFISQ